MPKYFILYHNHIAVHGQKVLHKTDLEANSEHDARIDFAKRPNGQPTIVGIKKGSDFSKAEIQRAKQSLR